MDTVSRRSLLQRIRAAASLHMMSTAGDGVGFLFTDKDSAIRFRALPGTRRMFCGFLGDGVATDYMMGCVVVTYWRSLSTASLGRLVHVAESEARTRALQTQREAVMRAAEEHKVNGPAAVQRRDSLLARALRVGGRGVEVRGEIMCRAGMQLCGAGLGKVVRYGNEETSYFVASVAREALAA